MLQAIRKNIQCIYQKIWEGGGGVHQNSLIARGKDTYSICQGLCVPISYVNISSQQSTQI